MNAFDLAISNTLFYLGVGFLVLGLIFLILSAFQRDRWHRKRLYRRGFLVFVFVGLLLLLRDVKLAYLESFARSLL